VEVDTDTLMRNLVLRNQVAIRTVNAGPVAFRAAVRDLRVCLDRWPKPVRSLITGRFRLRDHARALAKDPEAIKNVFSLEEA